MLIFLLGNLIPRHQELFYKNPVFAGVRLPEVKDAEAEPLESRYPKLPEAVIDQSQGFEHTGKARKNSSVSLALKWTEYQLTGCSFTSNNFIREKNHFYKNIDFW